MLGKLLKYEMRSTSRVMWFLYAAVLIVGTVIGIALRVQVNDANMGLQSYSYARVLFGLPQIILIIFVIIYVLLLFALAIMTVIMIIIRFNNNLLKGEGYLMHTLPVPTWMLVLSKTIVAAIWMAIGAAASILSAILLGLTSGMLPYILREGGLQELSDLMTRIFGNTGGLYIAVLIVSCIALILEFYISMAIGNLVNKNKFLVAVAAFIVIQIILAIISALIGNVSGALVISNPDLMTNGLVASLFTRILVKDLILNAAVAAAAFFGTTAILKKRLNLA